MYYRNKVQFTLQTDVTEEELFFTDTAEVSNSLHSHKLWI